MPLGHAKPVWCLLFRSRSRIMAVQQNKKTPSRRGMRRAHDAIVAPALSIEPETGEVHRRHHISGEGYYRGRKRMAGRGKDA